MRGRIFWEFWPCSLPNPPGRQASFQEGDPLNFEIDFSPPPDYVLIKTEGEASVEGFENLLKTLVFPGREREEIQERFESARRASGFISPGHSSPGRPRRGGPGPFFPSPKNTSAGIGRYSGLKTTPLQRPFSTILRSVWAGTLSTRLFPLRRATSCNFESGTPKERR